MIGQLSLEKELEVMAKWKLDANQWMVIRYLFMAVYENSPNSLFKYFTECAQTGAPREVLQALKDKKILSKTYKVPESGSPFVIEDVQFEDSFIKKYFKVSCEAGRELFEAYPNYLQMDNGKLLPARNIVSRVVFKSLDDFFLFYCKSIKFDKELHEEVLKSLEFAKQNKLIMFGLVEYVISEKWRDHIKSMKDNEIGTFNNRYDNIELQ